MDLCTVADVEARLGRSLNTEEAARAGAAITDVSEFLYLQAPLIPTTAPIPPVVVGVAARTALRVIVTDPSDFPVSSEGLGGYQTVYRSPDLALLDAEKKLLRPWRTGGAGGIPGVAAVQIDPITVYVSGGQRAS